MPGRLFAMVVAAGLLSTPSALAEDWPEFRGPTGQGIYSGGSLPLEWGPGRNVVWKQSIPGKGWSSPILHGRRIYLTTAVPVGDSKRGDQSLVALCLNAQTGKILWQQEVFRQDGMTAPRVHGKNSHASPTPITDGRRLYVHFGHQGTAGLDLDGKVLWRNTDLRYAPVHGNGGSPILADGALIFSCDGSDKQFIAALDCQTGKVRWQTDRRTNAYKKFSFSTPLLITAAGVQQLISAGSDVVCALDPRTGEEIWRVRYQGYSVVPRPVFGHGLLFVCTGFESPRLLAIRPDGRGDVTATHVAWTARRGVPLNPSPLLVGEELYLVSDGGLVSCLEATTGRVHWQERVNGSYSASPLHAGGRIYLQAEDGTSVILKAGRNFEQPVTNTLGERTLASPAAADGALYIRTEKHLYCIRAQ